MKGSVDFRRDLYYFRGYSTICTLHIKKLISDHKTYLELPWKWAILLLLVNDRFRRRAEKLTECIGCLACLADSQRETSFNFNCCSIVFQKSQIFPAWKNWILYCESSVTKAIPIFSYSKVEFFPKACVLSKRCIFCAAVRKIRVP